MKNLEVYLDIICESKVISGNEELKLCYVQLKVIQYCLYHVQSKFIQYQYMNASSLIIDKFTFKTIKIYENLFQVRAHCNIIVQPPHPLITNTRKNLYYTMDK